MNVEPGSNVSPRWVQWRRSVDLDEYDRRWELMASEGKQIHGEVDFIEGLFPDCKLDILDAGCGTGRLAIEAVRRGHRAMGVDLDPDMVVRALAKNPDIDWLCADLASVDLDRRFDVVVMAGNVPLFCAPGSQGSIIGALARHLAVGGALICGFSLEKGAHAYSALDFRRDAVSAGLDDVEQFANWDGDPSASDGSDDYAVIVCRRSADAR